MEKRECFLLVIDNNYQMLSNQYSGFEKLYFTLGIEIFV